MIRAALSVTLSAACSTPGPPSATGTVPASTATSTAGPSEPAPSAAVRGASAPSAPSTPSNAVSDAPTAPASGAAAEPGERIPCKTVRDCWVSSTPGRHPIARPARFKGRKFKPCRDGEAEPVCGDDGFCAVGRPLKC
jgi:hypothetical protein